MISWTPAGDSTGIIASTKANSDWCAVVEDSQVWSSPISASTPPQGEVPARLAWRERVSRAVDPRPLAVPEAEDAVVAAFAAHFGLLRAPQRGRREVLVDGRLDQDIGRLEDLRRPPELLVEPAERRAAVAGDVAGGTLADTAVARLLHEGETDYRLRAGDEDAALEEVVLVVEGDRLEAHCFLRRLPVRPP